MSKTLLVLIVALVNGLALAMEKEKGGPPSCCSLNPPCWCCNLELPEGLTLPPICCFDNPPCSEPGCQILSQDPPECCLELDLAFKTAMQDDTCPDLDIYNNQGPCCVDFLLNNQN